MAPTHNLILQNQAKLDSTHIQDMWRKVRDRHHDDPEGAISTVLESI